MKTKTKCNGAGFFEIKVGREKGENPYEIGESYRQDFVFTT